MVIPVTGNNFAGSRGQEEVSRCSLGTSGESGWFNGLFLLDFERRNKILC